MNQSAFQPEAESLQDNWGWALATGVCAIAIGVLGITVPLVTAITAELFLGMMFLIGGLVRTVYAFRNRKAGETAIEVITSLLAVGAGFLFLAFPLGGVLTLALILGGFFVLSGALNIANALSRRPAPDWGWMMFGGVVDLVLGALVWAAWPELAPWFLGLLVGIYFLWVGFSLVALAWLARKNELTAHGLPSDLARRARDEAKAG